MIYTVTLNPAIDYYISMNEFNEGELNSIENGYTLPGGKGINVSKVLKTLVLKVQLWDLQEDLQGTT